MFGLPISQGLVYLFGAIALVVALGTITYKLDHNGFVRGKAETEASFTKRDNAALQSALLNLKLANDKNRALEKKSQDDQSAVSQILILKDKTIKEINAKANTAIASGDLRLRVQLASCTAGSNGSPNGSTSTSGQPDNGTTATGFLGTADSAFLVNEASRADSIVAQLTAAQQALKADREVCK